MGKHMMNLVLTEDVFQCDDGVGGGCGRLFDGLIVPCIRGLCAECAIEPIEGVGC